MWIRHRICLFLFSFFPQILLVALCNSRAMGEANINSDIDLFIISKKGNLWTVRFIVTFISTILGIRRLSTHGLVKWTPEYIKKTKDRFCLSFFITEEAMNFESIRLQPSDLYLDKWMKTLVPLIHKKQSYERFMKINGMSVIPEFWNASGAAWKISGIQENKLREANFTNTQNDDIIHLDSGSHLSLLSQWKVLPGMTNPFEKLIKYLWLPYTFQNYEQLWKPWGVVISDTMLKFHDKDVRKEY